MDGNRRWARARGLPVLKGHEAGYEKLKEFVRWCKEFGIGTVYAYAFSTENWNRPKEEVGYLMKLLSTVLKTESNDLLKEKVRIKFVGQIEKFSPAIRFGIKKIEKATEKLTGLTLIICLSYGGRAEIISAIKKLVHERGGRGAAKITGDEFQKHLWTAGFPDPELIIRTSGEIRTSNFLPWQAAYSEWFFTKTLWPALSRREFEKILRDFAKRDIRRGR